MVGLAGVGAAGEDRATNSVVARVNWDTAKGTRWNTNTTMGTRTRV